MTTHLLQREYRRIWFWRHSPLMFTVFVCLFLGGIVSEFVQSLLPVRPFSFLSILNSHICSLPSTSPSNSVTSSCVLHSITLYITNGRLRRQISSDLELGYTLPITSRDTTARGGRYVRSVSPLGKEVTSLRYYHGRS